MSDTAAVAPDAPLTPPPGASGGAPSAQPPAFMQRYGEQMEGVQAADAQALEQKKSALSQPMSAFSNIRAAGVPAAPQQQKLPPAPDAKEYQKDAMAFASAMAVLGAVAGRFTRAPGGAALGAFGAALKGWQTGNLQAYENAAKQWEQNTKATIENNRQVMDKYRAALENRKMNIDEQMSQIQLISAQYHDQIMYDAAAAKNYTLVAQIYEKNFEYTQKASDAAAKLQEKRTEQQTKNEQSAAYWLSPAGQQKFSTLPPAQQASVKQLIDIYANKQGGGEIDPTMVEQLARQDLAGDQSWKTNVGRGAQGGAMLRAVATRKAAIMADENITPEQVAANNQTYKARQAGLSAEERTGGTTAANLEIIMRNAHAAIPMAVAASEKVPRGTWVPINQLVQTAESKISDPALKEFRIANLQLAELWARGMNPRGVMRESDRDLALQMLSTADSPQTYKRVAQQLENFLQREMTSVREFRQHVPPGTLGGGGGEPRPTAPSPTAGAPDDGSGWTVRVK